MATIVLVHGAFRGGWSWKHVRQRLAARGHEVFAPSLTGAGERAHALELAHGARAAIALRTYIDDIASLLRFEDLRDVVLVGHSHGGFVCAAASEVIADRIGRLVFVDAPVPSDGETASDMMPKAAQAAYGGPPPGDEVAPIPIRASGAIDEGLAAWMNARLTPHPVKPSYEPVRLRDASALALPRTYAFFRETPPFFPCATTRARLDAAGTPYHLLDGGHDGILTHPDPVAALIHEVAATL